MECGFSDIFSRHICYTVAETVDVTSHAASFGAKNVQKTTFEAVEMMLSPWSQQDSVVAKGFLSQPAKTGTVTSQQLVKMFFPLNEL